ncbi:MAG: ABC transporter ATP-binding protein [Holosporales bacterium]
MSVAVRAENIIMDFPTGEGERVRVLHGVSLAVPGGELAMLVGPSGCGKTTLLSILTGILTPSSGKAYIWDKEITGLQSYAKVLVRRRDIGFIFQQYNLIPALTAVENAAVPLIADNIDRTMALEKAAAVLDSIGMGDHLQKTPSQLSGGQQQRVCIARALVHDPKLIVCDEPTAALDNDTGHKVMDILSRASKNSERAVLVVTHDNRIFDYADRIFTMSDGTILHEKNRELSV